MTATAQTPDMTATSGNQDMIAAYLRHLRQLGRAESTINTYMHILNRTERVLPYGLLSDDDELMELLADLPTRGTRAVYRAALTGCYAWAVREKWIDGDPSVGLPVVPVRKGLPRPVPTQQLRTILPALDGPVRLWSLLALRQGLRCIEIARLRWPQDVTEDALYVTGKGSYERSIPTHPEVWAALAGHPHGPVADFAGGTERVRKYVSRRCRIEFDKLGQWTPHITAHRLRHTFATHLIEAGVPTRVVQALMGHSKVATTEIYTQVTPQAARSAVLRLPGLPL